LGIFGAALGLAALAVRSRKSPILPPSVQIIIDKPVALTREQIEILTPIRREIMRIMYDNFFDRHSKPYTTQKELMKRLDISSPSLIRHLKKLEENALISKIRFSEIERDYQYHYHSRTEYVYYVDRTFHEI